jgi:hypothetical protein
VRLYAYKKYCLELSSAGVRLMHAASHPFCTSLPVQPCGKVAVHSAIAGVYSEGQSHPAREFRDEGHSLLLNCMLIDHLKCETDLNNVKTLCATTR